MSFSVDSLIDSGHNQFLRPYSYAQWPLVDPHMYLVLPPSVPQAGLLNFNWVQNETSTFPHVGMDKPKCFSNDGATNGSDVVSPKMSPPVCRNITDMGCVPFSEQQLATPKSPFYTQFGSFSVELPQHPGNKSRTSYGSPSSELHPHQRCTLDVHAEDLQLCSSAESAVTKISSVVFPKREKQHLHPTGVGGHVEALPISADQDRFSGSNTTEKESPIVYNQGFSKKPGRDVFFVDNITANVSHSVQEENHVSLDAAVVEDSSSVSNEPLTENNTENKTLSSKPQKSVDYAHKGSKNTSGQWVPMTKETREEVVVNRMGSATMSEDLTSKIGDEPRLRRSFNQGWRTKLSSARSPVQKEESMLSRKKKFDRSSKTNTPLQQGPLGLPSGSKVDSAPSSATEHSKQALQVSPDNTAESRMMQESSDAPGTAVLRKFQGVENERVLYSGTPTLSELDSENEAEEDTMSKHKSLASEVPNVYVKESDKRVGKLNKSNRREPFHRFDAGKCTTTLLAIFEALIPPADEEKRRKQLLTSLDELVSGIWSEARLFLFGSCANAFGVCNSDIDVCLSIEGESATRSEVVCTLAEALKANHMQNVQALTHARVPIVKYSDPKTGISCDVCVNNMLAVVNTKLLHDYAQIDVRLRQLAFIVKHWAKCRQVNETYRGTLSSYAYVLMCIHFLQQRRPPVLPCLQEMEPTYRVTVGDIDCAYFDKVDNLKGFGQQNKETLADLVWSFFDYWAFRHDYTHTVISIRTGKYLSKVEKDWTRRIGNECHLICIEDPFEVSHDLGRVVDKHSIRVLRDEFRRAARIMQQEVNPCPALFEPYIRQKAQAA
ncbi:hypothetical protein KP509_04G087500 [Ceratopteris richardii]|nr:hypothetical protein KP509_04G087500 [Ceratopteris richardii]